MHPGPSTVAEVRRPDYRRLLQQNLPRAAVWGTIFLTALSVAFYLLCFVHLQADFPNFSPWNDWAKTTDEGWYAGGAVHRAVFGSWITPGAFNPVLAMPVWPALAHAWFRVVGFGIVQLRIASLLLFGCSLLLLYGLVRRAAGPLYAALAVVLLTANPFIYSFVRLALLEQVMLFWLLAAWTFGGLAARQRGYRGMHYAALTGLCLTAMVLSKTTSLVLIPAALWYQWGSACEPAATTQRVRNALTSLAVAVSSWLIYDVLVIRHHLADYRLVFNVNSYRVHLSILPRVAWATLWNGTWIDPALYALALAVLVVAVFRLRELWRQPLFTAAVMAAAAYLAFICYHSNLQPRYYLVAAPPLVVVLVLGLKAIADRARDAVTARQATIFHTTAAIGGALLAVTLIGMGTRTLHYAAHPEYRYLTAMNGAAAMILADPTHPLIVANQGDNLSLFTGVQSICDEYNGIAPAELLKQYKPGWYATVSGGRPTLMLQAIQARYQMEERAHYEIFDDPDRHTFTLFRLVPREDAPPTTSPPPLLLAVAQPHAR